MLNFETGKVKLLSTVTVNGSPIELGSPVELIIRNSDTGLYWNDADAFASSPFLHTMTYDATAQYYFYTNSNLVLQGLYEAIFISDNIENSFRVVEQFLIVPALFNPTDISSAVWESILEGTTTAEEMMRTMLGVLANITTVENIGGGLSRITYKSLDGEKDRAVITHDVTGVRSVSVLDGS